MDSSYRIESRAVCADVRVAFSTVLCLLQESRDWGGRVLKYAGASNLIVRAICMSSLGPWRSRILPESQEHFRAWGNAGRRTKLTYLIENSAPALVRITPQGFLLPHEKIFSALLLLCCGLLPVFLAPLVWRAVESRRTERSRLYLDAFCRYLMTACHPEASSLDSQ